MRAVILAGGRGVRLRPLTYSVPKVLLPVGEKPILEVIIQRLRSFSFEEFILAVGYRAELIETYFRDGSHLGVRIDYVRESEPLGTAGPLSLVRQACAFDENESVLVMNGDILTKLDFTDLLDFHRRGGWEMTMAVRPYEARVPYGVIDLDGERVSAIREKPVSRCEVSGGIYVIRSPVMAAVPENTFFDMPDLAAKLMAEGKPVGAYRFSDYWLALDQMQHLEDAQHDLSEWE